MGLGFTEKLRELGRQEFSLKNVHSLYFHIGVTGIFRDTGETENWDCLASSGAMQVPVFRSRVHRCHLRQRQAKKHLSNQSQVQERHKPQWSEHCSKRGPGCWHTCSVRGKEAPGGKSQIPPVSCPGVGSVLWDWLTCPSL